MKLTIYKCNDHSVYSITIMGEAAGHRLTPGKCCGNWSNEIKSWNLDESMCDEMIKEFKCAKKDIKKLNKIKLKK